jgi:hypothetical protein
MQNLNSLWIWIYTMNTLWICTYTLDSIILLLLSGELQIIMFQDSIIVLLYYVLNLVMTINLSVNCSIKKCDYLRHLFAKYPHLLLLLDK